MLSDPNTERQVLRHLLATLAYRAAKATRNPPPGFGEFRPHVGSRTPLEILAHLGDLCDWALTLAKGQEQWPAPNPLPWSKELPRFFASLKTLDDFLAGPGSLACSPLRLMQGPVADAIWHAGQIALLRRMFDSPIRGENYFKADIKAGQIGADQPAPRKEFE